MPLSPLPAVSTSSLPRALDAFAQIAQTLQNRTAALFLDYDGTCTPIVSHPSDARVKPSTVKIIERVSEKMTSAIVTGRKYETITQFINVRALYYAASHGFDIRGPSPLQERGAPSPSPSLQTEGAPTHPVLKCVAEEFLHLLGEVRDGVRDKLRHEGIQGALVEDNTFSISVHYRNVSDEKQRQAVHEAVNQATKAHGEKLQMLPGKMVWEVRPLIEWHKGEAVQYLLSVMHPNVPSETLAPICMGDDTTDEDAFRLLQTMKSSITVLVLPEEGVERQTNAKYTCRQDEVESFLQRLADLQ